MVSVVLSKGQLTFEAITSMWSKVCGVQKVKITAASNDLSMFLTALCSDKSSPGNGESRRHFQDTAAFALEIFHSATDEEKRAIDYQRWETQAEDGNAKRFLSGIQITARNMRFIVTDRGSGIAPAVVREGDECVILRGGKMPFLLRKVDGLGNYKFVGGMFHLSEHEHEHEDTGWHVGRDKVVHTDWNNWDHYNYSRNTATLSKSSRRYSGATCGLFTFSTAKKYSRGLTHLATPKSFDLSFLGGGLRKRPGGHIIGAVGPYGPTAMFIYHIDSVAA